MHDRPFNYDATPLGPLGIPVIIHNKPIRLKSWNYIIRDGFGAGAVLNNYLCQRAIDIETKVVSIMDTVNFRHKYLTQTGLTPTDRLIHAFHTLTSAMYHAPAVNSEEHLLAIEDLHCLFHTWGDTKTKNYPETHDVPMLKPYDVTCRSQYSPIEKPSNPS